ncbi:uncharacterized protein trdc [Odontesthes bonariensis]|uniref:uncharacterized protein trdc n=1 Tax=Odontesthes bonariensis TaxID=219752 RepID=UPI003F581D8B
MVMNVRGGPTNISTTTAVMSTVTKSYYFAGFSNKTIHSCEMRGASTSNEADDLCEGIYPEKARLNFYLLLMNSVRVVFTKCLAFNTILTIRVMLF